MDLVLPVLAGLILLAILAAILVILRLDRARREDRQELIRLTEIAGGLASSQAELGGRLNQMAQQTAADRVALSTTLETRLDGVGKRLGEGLEQSATKTAESLGLLKKHLEVIDQAQRNITDLAGQVVGLQEILDNKQARGAFGEVQLQDLVTAVLPPNAYAFQSSLSNGKRVDCLIRLPNPPGPICIDSKFPLESYHALRQARDDAAQKLAQREFRAAMLKHVNDIRDRYIVAGETADSALMFLPSEAVYAELHANFSDTVAQSYRARVWIVSPTTLMATLNTVRAVLKDARMREQAGVIQVEVQKLTDDVQRLDKRVDNLRRHFAQAEGDLREIGVSSEKILRRAERIEQVQLEEAETAAPLSELPLPDTEISPLPRLGAGD